VESPNAGAPRAGTRRSGHGSRARAHLAGHHKGAQSQQQASLCVDESGFYPLPSVVRTYAPVGPTPILRPWWTREPLSAISALSLAGKLDFHGQDRALNSADVAAFLAHVLREVPGRMVISWDGAPIHRCHLIQDFLANGAAERVQVERLPGYGPALKPHEGFWAYQKGVELRNVRWFDRPHLRRELRDAVKRVRRKPRVIEGFVRGAKL
jgi:transposase